MAARGAVGAGVAARVAGLPARKGMEMATGTVLVVDDDPSIIALIETALADEGYQVMAAVGAGALTVAHDRQPDLILLDIMMPGMDGVEVSQRLRTDETTASIPIVAMSAH